MVALGSRLLDLPKWDREEYRLDGEHILATHDAFYWLAGARGVGDAQGSPLAILARTASWLTGASPGEVAFWIPALTAGLVAVMTALWAWTLGGPRRAGPGETSDISGGAGLRAVDQGVGVEAGLPAGILAALAPGLVFRTRLGYYDTDIVTLFFPLLLSWALLRWSGSHLRPSWLPARNAAVADSLHSGPLPGPAMARSLLWMTLIGLFGRFMAVWHPHLAVYVKLAWFMTALLALGLARPGRRGYLLWGLVVFGLSAFSRTWGLAGSAALALGLGPGLAAAPVRWRVRILAPWSGVAALLLLAMAAGIAASLWDGSLWLVETYLKPVAQNATDGVATDAPVYPAVVQSIIEAQNLDVGRLLGRLHPWHWVGPAGLAGFLLVLAARPGAILLLPLLALALSALKLGTRMSMFGGPAMALGLTLPVFWLLGRILAGRSWRGLALLALAGAASLVLMAPGLSLLSRLAPTPVLRKEHCLALEALGRLAPPDALVWTWWDWGYATNYYARRASFADGGRHDGKYLLPLGLAMITPSPLQARQLMAFSASHGDRPWEVWDRQPAREVRRFLHSLGGSDQGLHPTLPRYLVVTMENITLLGWIGFYGTWDPVTGDGVHPRVARLDQEFVLRRERGDIWLKESEMAVPLRAMDSLTASGRESTAFDPKNEWWLLLFPETEDYFLLDDLAWNSLNVQLLLRDPKDPDVAPHFRLVYEDYPLVRIFEAR